MTCSSAGTTTEIRIRTSRPSTSKPSTPVPIPTAARGRSGATGAARAAAAVPGAGARSAAARNSARATSARRTSGANRQRSCSNPAPYASRARHLMRCRRYPGKVVKIHSDGTVDVKRVTVWKSRLSPTPSTRSPDSLTQWLMSAQVRGRRQRHAAQGEVRESCRFRVRLRPEALAQPQP